MIPKELKEIVDKEGLKEELIENIYNETKQQFIGMFPETMTEEDKENKILTMVKAKIIRNTTAYKQPNKYKLIVIDATGVEKNRRGNEYEVGTIFGMVEVNNEWHFARINYYENLAGYINSYQPMTAYEVGLIPKKVDGPIWSFVGSEGEIPMPIQIDDLETFVKEEVMKKFGKAELGKARIEAQSGIEGGNLSKFYDDLKVVEAYVVRPVFGVNNETKDKYGSYNIMSDDMKVFDGNEKPVRVFTTYRQVRYQEPSIIAIIGRVSAYKGDVVINAEAIIPIAAIPIQKLGDDGGFAENEVSNTPTYSSDDIEET